MLSFLRHFLLALQFFTRIPVTGRLAQWVGYSPAMLRACAAHFPAVGALVGAATAAVLWGTWQLLPAQSASAWVAVLVSTAFGVVLTGAFHEDGLADCADGLGGAVSRERALAIMKDSRLGSYGVLALVLALLLKLALLVVLLQAQALWALVGLWAAHTTSRLLPLLVMWRMAYVGDVKDADGAALSKAKPVADGISARAVGVGVLWWLSIMALASVWLPVLALLWATLCAAGAAAWLAWRLQRRLQGFTGDTLGAVQQLAELGFYAGLVVAQGALA